MIGAPGSAADFRWKWAVRRVWAEVMFWGLVFAFIFLAVGAIAFAYLVKGKA